MDLHLNNKKAIIVDVSRGIGLAIVVFNVGDGRSVLNVLPDDEQW